MIPENFKSKDQDNKLKSQGIVGTTVTINLGTGIKNKTIQMMQVVYLLITLFYTFIPIAFSMPCTDLDVLNKKQMAINMETHNNRPVCKEKKLKCSA